MAPTVITIAIATIDAPGTALCLVIRFSPCCRWAALMRATGLMEIHSATTWVEMPDDRRSRPVDEPPTAMSPRPLANVSERPQAVELRFAIARLAPRRPGDRPGRRDYPLQLHLEPFDDVRMGVDHVVRLVGVVYHVVELVLDALLQRLIALARPVYTSFHSPFCIERVN